MLIDILFFGFPLIFMICMAAHALRESDPRYWRPAFSFLAYCTFYLAGGREVLLYLLVGVMIGGGYLGCGGASPAL